MPCIWICGAAAGVFLVASVIKLLQVWFVNRQVRRVDFASYRSANWNIADAQHFRSQQISGQETGTSNIIDSRNSRNNNSPDINQSYNCSNYETHHQNTSDLQKRTRCDERVSEVTPEGRSTFDRDRSYSDSSKESSSRPSCNSRSFQAEKKSVSFDQIQKMLHNIKGDFEFLQKRSGADSNIDGDISLLLNHFGSPNVSTESLPNPKGDSSLDSDAKKEQDASADSNSQTSSLANEAGEIQKALQNMEATLLEFKTKLPAGRARNI